MNSDGYFPMQATFFLSNRVGIHFVFYFYFITNHFDWFPDLAVLHLLTTGKPTKRQEI